MNTTRCPTYPAQWEDGRWRNGYWRNRCENIQKVTEASLQPRLNQNLSDDGIVGHLYLFLKIQGVPDAHIVVFFDINDPGGFRDMFYDIFGMKLKPEIEQIMAHHALCFDEPKPLMVRTKGHLDGEADWIILEVRRPEAIEVIEHLVDKETNAHIQLKTRKSSDQETDRTLDCGAGDGPRNHRAQRFFDALSRAWSRGWQAFRRRRGVE